MHLVDKHEEKSNSKLEKQNPKFDKLFKEKDIQIIDQTSEQSRLKWVLLNQIVFISFLLLFNIIYIYIYSDVLIYLWK